MEVAAARAFEAELERHLGEALHIRGTVVAGGNLHPDAARFTELAEQRPQLGRGELVARRMSDHRHAAGAADPFHCLHQCRPAVRHVARLALGEEAREDFARVVADADLHQVASEVRARHQVRIANVGQRTFVGISDAGRRQPVGHLARAARAAGSHIRQAVTQRTVGRVDAQADDMHGVPGKSHRHLDPRHEAQAEIACSRSGLGQPAHLVVIGQGEQLDTLRARASNQFAGCQRAVGIAGVGMEIGVDLDCSLHGRILRFPHSPPCRHCGALSPR